jgi:hypothetical protein
VHPSIAGHIMHHQEPGLNTYAIANVAGASPARQQAALDLGSSLDGLLLAGAALKGGGVQPFVPGQTKLGMGSANEVMRSAPPLIKVGNEFFIPYTGSGSLFRGDTRGPSNIFGNSGFQPRGQSTNLEKHVTENSGNSIFVSTSRLSAVARGEEFTGGTGGYVDEINPRGLRAIDVNATLGVNPLAREREIAIAGGIPSSAIKSARPVMPDGRLGQEYQNPFYRGGN